MTRILYLDGESGMSGNMFVAALLDAGIEEEPWRAAIATIPLPVTEVILERVQKQGIRALHMDVRFPEEHVHRHLSDIVALIDAASLREPVKGLAKRIFHTLATAEAAVHGISVDEVHFHEVGAVDAIIDIVSAAYLLDASGAERVICSPVRLGQGTVSCAHGMMPIPAPATALLMRDIPSFAGDVRGELTTPTGAAILKTVVSEFGPQPPMIIAHVGHGAGSRDTPHPNLVRAFLGDSWEAGHASSARARVDSHGVFWQEEEVIEIETHIDDMTGESLGYLCEELRRTPALDVMMQPAYGKKSRPAVVVRVIAQGEHEAEVLTTLFRHSSTIGARVRRERRVSLPRNEVTLTTPFGEVRAKETLVGGERRLSPEYEDLLRYARESGLPLDTVRLHFERAALGD